LLISRAGIGQVPNVLTALGLPTGEPPASSSDVREGPAQMAHLCANEAGQVRPLNDWMNW